MTKKIGKKEAIMAALQGVESSKIKDDEFTLKEYVAECEKTKGKTSYTASRQRLDKLIREGILKKRSVLIDGFRINLYSPV